MWYMCMAWYYSAMKKYSICKKMDRPRNYLAKWNKSESDGYCVFSPMWKLGSGGWTWRGIHYKFGKGIELGEGQGKGSRWDKCGQSVYACMDVS